MDLCNPLPSAAAQSRGRPWQWPHHQRLPSRQQSTWKWGYFWLPWVCKDTAKPTNLIFRCTYQELNYGKAKTKPAAVYNLKERGSLSPWKDTNRAQQNLRAPKGFLCLQSLLCPPALKLDQHWHLVAAKTQQGQKFPEFVTLSKTSVMGCDRHFPDKLPVTASSFQSLRTGFLSCSVRRCKT